MQTVMNFARGIGFATCLGLASSAYAVPSLQLGIAGGTYDTSSETSVSNGPIFDLYAYLNTQNANSPAISETFYLSMALSPAVSETNPAPDFGTFTYDIGGGAVLVNAASDMVFGVPPVDLDNGASDPQDLQTHGIFPTYFLQVALTFSATDLSKLYDTQNVDDAAPVTPGVGDDTMFFHKISLDLSNLTGGKQLHFDLFTQTLVNSRCSPQDINCVPTLVDIDAGDNAPFSHDAQSGPSSSGGGPSSGEVPEPGTLSLIGAGILLGSMTWFRRRARRG